MFSNLRAWMWGKRDGVEKAMREAVEGPDPEATQPIAVVKEPGDAQAVQQVPTMILEDGSVAPLPQPAPLPEPPKPVQIIITFEAEGSAEFSFHRDARISAMMMWPVIEYMRQTAALQYDRIILNQERAAAEETQKKIKIARNPLPRFPRKHH